MTGPKAGDRISEYVLVEQIGAGTFGQVWKAHHHVWKDQLVAIKVPTDIQYVRNLQKEGAAVHGLRHENVVRAIGLDPYADPPYFVMEFVDGASLRQVIQNHPKGLPVSLAREVLTGLLRALEHAHGAGVIHRDIKPENILVSGGADRSLDTIAAEDVKITDFGLGQMTGMTAGSILQSGSLVSADGKSLSGTIAYMAPEQRDGQPVDARSDLYAVGIVLFEMLTGERPSGSDMPRQVRADLPEWADAVFAKMYTRRERRFASAGEALAELERLAAPPVLRGAGRGGVTAGAGTLRQIMPAVGGSGRISGGASGAMRRTCPKCRHPADGDDNYCIICGAQLVTQPRRCGQCGAYPEAKDRFCIFCGSALPVAVV